MARFALPTTPLERPSLARAQVLYAESCATCHGASGNADTERARTLDPSPARFKDPERLGQLSPYRIYNALTFGVPGTAMASFADALPPADRWNLAFFVFRLGHEGEPVGAAGGHRPRRHGPPDRPEVLAALTAESTPGALHRPRLGAPRGRLHRASRGSGDRAARARWCAARWTPTPPADRPRRIVSRSTPTSRASSRSSPGSARAMPDGTKALETAFQALRASMARSETADHVRTQGQALDRRLGALGETRRPVVPFVAAFLIYLREGIEAALLVGALLAGLRRLGRADAARYIHAGWLLALPAGVATWWLLDRAISLGADQRELMEAGVALLAAAVLFSVSFWMISKVESRHWMAYLRAQLERGLSQSSLAVLSGLAFLAVYREAAETILFTQALLLESETRARPGLGGGGGGPPDGGRPRLRDEPDRAAPPARPLLRGLEPAALRPRGLVRRVRPLRAGVRRLSAAAAGCLPRGRLDGDLPRPHGAHGAARDRPRDRGGRARHRLATAPRRRVALRRPPPGPLPERGPRPRPPRQARLRSLPGDARVVERVLPELRAGLEEKDVRDDPALEARYVFEIPVLLLGDARSRATA